MRLGWCGGGTKVVGGHLWVRRHVDDYRLGVGHAQLSNLPEGIALALQVEADLVQCG